jgi:hypothetical protein
VRLELSAWGWVFRLKWRRPLRRVQVLLDARAPIARITPIDRRGSTGVLDGTTVRIETAAGELVAALPESRSALGGYVTVTRPTPGRPPPEGVHVAYPPGKFV